MTELELVEPAVTAVLSLELRPHIERAGYHTERFDAYLGDQLISTHRSGWHNRHGRSCGSAIHPRPCCARNMPAAGMTP
jgi:hypothetical protein